MNAHPTLADFPVRPQLRLGESLAGWCWRSLTPRLCPVCVASSGYHCLLWDLPLMSACPLHACLLVENCHACGLTYTWRTLRSGWLCACGAKVSERPVVCAPKWAIGSHACEDFGRPRFGCRAGCQCQGVTESGGVSNARCLCHVVVVPETPPRID